MADEVQVPWRRDWLKLMNVSKRVAREFGLDKHGMTDLAWLVMAKEMLRCREYNSRPQLRMNRRNHNGGSGDAGE